MLTYLYTLLSSHKSEKGQDFAEYALLLFLIALVVVVAVVLLGPVIANVYTLVAAAL